MFGTSAFPSASVIGYRDMIGWFPFFTPDVGTTCDCKYGTDCVVQPQLVRESIVAGQVNWLAKVFAVCGHCFVGIKRAIRHNPEMITLIPRPNFL